MKYVTPLIFTLAETKLNFSGRKNFFNHLLKGKEWQTNAASDAEELMEIAGKLCYLSFGEDLNKNLTRTREGKNFEYIQNLIKLGHESVLEHGTITFAICNVSRIFTHELVRHRVGCAYSQVSGRYVRANDMSFILPFFENAELQDDIRKIVDDQEKAYAMLVDKYLNCGIVAFNRKKELTSALRRVTPNGSGNHIIMTANHRILRHIIKLRTSKHAEFEIRYVFNKINKYLVDKFPAIYSSQ